MRWKEAEQADIGYKIQKGDWIVMVMPFGKKAYTVTKTTRNKAICEFKSNRDALKFSRYYSLPFIPLEKKTKPDYQSPNTWHVRVQNNLKNMRLRYE